MVCFPMIFDALARIDNCNLTSLSAVSHRDFLGAVLGCGINRTKVGDILINENGAHALLVTDVLPLVEMAVTSVRDVKTQTRSLAVSDVRVPERRMKHVTSVENSLRLDAVVSAGLKVSRGKLADMVRGGLVQVNYREVKAPAKNVKEGDVVSVRGVGKLEIGGWESTSKGRYRIEMKKYI